VLPPEGRALAYLIRVRHEPTETTFPVPADVALQVGFIVYPKEGEVKRHVHLPIERHLVGMTEVLLVRRGACEIDLYDDDRELVATETLRTGDIIVIVGGGHGLRMTEDTVLLEVKQGPYAGPGEKEPF
jgi:hypothetical protein